MNMPVLSFLRRPLCAAAAATALLLPGRAAAQATPAPAGTESAHFNAVARHLELGGLFFGYMDIDGDLAKLAEVGDKFLDIARKQEDAPPIPADLKAAKLVDALGLNSLKAIGMSSRSLGKDLYHNRALLYMPGGAKGVLRLFGGKAAPFSVASFAPADADFAFQAELTLSTLRETVEAVLGTLGDESMLDQFKGLQDFPIPPLNMTAGEVLEKLDTRVMVVGSVDDSRKLTLPGAPLQLPAFKLLIALDGLDFIMDPLLAFAGETDSVAVEKGDGFNIIRPSTPMPGELDYFRPGLYHDVKSKKLIFATDIEYARTALAGKSPLKDNADFKKAFTGLPAEGNGLTYASRRFLTTMSGLTKELMGVAGDLGGGGPSADMLGELSRIAQELAPVPDQGLAGIYANVPEGMLFLSNLNENHKHTLVQLVALPIAIGAAAFGSSTEIQQAVQEAAGEEESSDSEPSEADSDASPEKTVRSNLQQIAFAAQTWFIDNPSAKQVTYDQLVAAELLFALKPVAGEKYKGLTLKRAGGRIVVTTRDGDEVTYGYPAVTD